MTAEQIVEFAEALGRVAASGGGATALAAALAGATGCPVLVEDADWRPIATAGTGSLPATARGGGNGLRTIPIGLGTAPHGWLSVAGGGDEATPAMRLAASAMAVEIARETHRSWNRKHGFWEQLVDGAFHDAGTAREEAAARGIVLAPAYVFVALESERGAALAPLAAEAFRSGESELGVVERGGIALVAVPSGREIDAENARTAAALLPKAAAKRGIDGGIAGGVSAAVALAAAAEGVASAQAALAIARRLYGFGRVVSASDLGAYPLLYRGATLEELRAFAERTLQPLRAYDEKHQTELERTLRVYFQSGQNVKTAAAELAVHRHTVFYRLRQIGDITGRSLESHHDQLTLRLAIAIDALHT